ncbi:hypothetical protein BIW11_09816 [Tropilaelaps mercedesae]|uniref:Uncharacterized protein n=1 Tax=Tropilaelaps mercedesae TaxID=418985 RepID=A0A1V9XIE2_9ACAR|nr:hypothetical protein BIW11_09816 [Tropilaelaps mercedesae]
MGFRVRMSVGGVFAMVLLALIAPMNAKGNLTDDASSLIDLLGGVVRTLSSYYQRIVIPVKSTQELLYGANDISKTNCRQDACTEVCAEEGCARSFCYPENDLCYCAGCKLADLIVITKKPDSFVDYLSRPLEDCTPQSCYVNCHQQKCKESWCAFGSSCLCFFC